MKNKVLILMATAGVCVTSPVFAMDSAKEERYAYVKKRKLRHADNLKVEIWKDYGKENENIKELNPFAGSSVLIFPIDEKAPQKDNRIATPGFFYTTESFQGDANQRPWCNLLDLLKHKADEHNTTARNGNVTTSDTDNSQTFKMDKCRIVELWYITLLVEDIRNPSLTIEGRSYYPAQVVSSECDSRVLEIVKPAGYSTLTYSLNKHNIPQNIEETDEPINEREGRAKRLEQARAALN